MSPFNKAIKDTAEYLSCGMSCRIHKTDFTVTYIMGGEDFEECFELEDESDEDGDKTDQHYFIEKPQSFESFEIMRQFVEERVEKSNHIKSLTIALEGKKPFRQFRIWVENCQLLDEWYAYRQEKLEEYVREQLNFTMGNLR